jgi:hypothetical protein
MQKYKLYGPNNPNMPTTEDLLNRYVRVPEFDTARAPLMEVLFQNIRSWVDDAPASTSTLYHNAHNGGLVNHLMDVVDSQLRLCTGYTHPSINYTSLVTVGLLHDVYKAVDPIGHPYFVVKHGKYGTPSDTPYEKNNKYLNWSDASGYLEFVTSKSMDAPDSRAMAWLVSQSGEPKPRNLMSILTIASYCPELLTSLTDDEFNSIKYISMAYDSDSFSLRGKESPLMIISHAADMLSSRS